MRTLCLNKIHVSFEPALWEKPKRGQRMVIIIDERGRELRGITIRYSKMGRLRINVPQDLTLGNRPEYGENTLNLSQVDREALRERLQSELNQRPELRLPRR